VKKSLETESLSNSDMVLEKQKLENEIKELNTALEELKKSLETESLSNSDMVLDEIFS